MANYWAVWSCKRACNQTLMGIFGRSSSKAFFFGSISPLYEFHDVGLGLIFNHHVRHQQLWQWISLLWTPTMAIRNMHRLQCGKASLAWNIIPIRIRVIQEACMTKRWLICILCKTVNYDRYSDRNQIFHQVLAVCIAWRLTLQKNCWSYAPKWEQERPIEYCCLWQR